MESFYRHVPLNSKFRIESILEWALSTVSHQRELHTCPKSTLPYGTSPFKIYW